MINSKFIIVGENIIKDAESNNISVINILEDISAESFPILIQKMAILIYFEKESHDDDKPTLVLKVSNNNKILVEHTIKADFRGKNKNRNIIKFGGILFPEPGDAKFEIIDTNNDNQIVCKYLLTLKLRTPVKVA